jgi:hypothetical protein
LELVSSFLEVEVKNLKYLFFLVTWNEFVSPVTEQLYKQREALGSKGSVIQAFKSAKGDTFREMLAKKWPKDIAERLEHEQDPFMMIIAENFGAFDPRTNPWGVVWFSNFFDRPDSIYPVLHHYLRRYAGTRMYSTICKSYRKRINTRNLANILKSSLVCSELR